MTEDKISDELVIVTCGDILDCIPFVVSMISLHRMFAKPVINLNKLFFVLKYFHASVTVIPINIVYKQKYGLGVTHFFSSFNSYWRV